MASFAVVAIVREERGVLSTFVEHYLSLGAVEVALYCDGPVPEAFFAHEPRVRLISCDAGMWGRLGLVDPVHHERQGAAYAHYVPRAPGDWTLVVDADELMFGDAPVGALLDRVPRGVESIGLPSAEAVYGPKDDEDRPFGSRWFRVAVPRRARWALPLVYGAEVARLMRSGLLAHTAGKQFVRSGSRGLEFGAHSARRDGRRVTRDARRWMTGKQRWWIGHFDAISFDRWAQKWRVRVDQPEGFSRMKDARARQQAQVIAALEAGPTEARALFRRYYRLSALSLGAMRAAGIAFRRDVV